MQVINKPLVTFHLEGQLGKLYGPEYKFAVKSVSEGLRAMSYQLKGDKNTPAFRDQLRKGRYKILRDGREIGLEEISIGLGRTKEVHIIPEPTGEGGGTGKFIFGFLLSAAALIVAGPGGFGLAGGLGFSGAAAPTITFGQIAAAGGLIAAAGAAQMLSPTPAAVDTRVQERPEERPSFLMNTVTNTSEEGLPVPVVHGKKILVGSHVISAGISVEETPLGDIIDIPSDFTEEYTFAQEFENDGPPGDGDYRGFNDAAGAVKKDNILPFFWPANELANDPLPVKTFFRGTKIRNFFEVKHDSAPSGPGAQHALRITLNGDHGREFIKVFEIEQPAGVVVFVKTSASANLFATGKRNEPEAEAVFGVQVTVWEWTLAAGAPFDLDGSTDLVIRLSYDAP